MSKLVLDVETTIKNKGNPFTHSNKLVNVGWSINNGPIQISYSDDPDFTTRVQSILDESKIIIGFNIKFDLHWLRRYNFKFDHCRVWDCQIAEFLLEGQTNPYPSLNKAAEKYNLGSKLDIIKEEYWDKGIDTDQIPRDVLDEYLTQDVELTNRVYHNQLPLIKSQGLSKLMSLLCADLLVLQDMEYNGTLLDTEQSLVLAEKEVIKIDQLEKELKAGYEDIPINWNSRDHLSCYLYGGTIIHEDRICIGTYKSGAKEGQPRYKKLEYKFDLPQQLVPPKGSELAKEGYYATDDGTLRSVKASKEVKHRINTILERSKSNKLVGTYYRGLPELIAEMEWPAGYIHGTFNQCVAATGRLSSSRPNLQNFAGDVKVLLTTRY